MRAGNNTATMTNTHTRTRFFALTSMFSLYFEQLSTAGQIFDSTMLLDEELAVANENTLLTRQELVRVATKLRRSLKNRNARRTSVQTNNPSRYFKAIYFRLISNVENMIDRRFIKKTLPFWINDFLFPFFFLGESENFVRYWAEVEYLFFFNWNENSIDFLSSWRKTFLHSDFVLIWSSRKFFNKEHRQLSEKIKSTHNVDRNISSPSEPALTPNLGMKWTQTSKTLFRYTDGKKWEWIRTGARDREIVFFTQNWIYTDRSLIFSGLFLFFISMTQHAVVIFEARIISLTRRALAHRR